METCNFSIILMEFCRFSKIFNLYRIFRENLDENLEKFRNVNIYRVLAIFLKSKSKIHDNLQFLIISMNMLRFFKRFSNFIDFFRENLDKHLGKFENVHW